MERVSLDVPMPSNSALTKAGAALRPMMSGLELTTAQIDAAIEAIPIVDRWRSSFAPVMNATKAWLRSAIVTANCSKSVLEVKSRHKQWPSILQKLHARQNMRLAQMEDVAGCRVVLQSIGEVRRLEQQLHRGARSVTFGPTDDYVAQPRRGGYRAVHLHTVRTVRQGGEVLGAWRVEVQLRTELQHTWAEAVETFDSAFGCDVKHEDAPEEVLVYFRALAEYYADLDHGVDADASATELARVTPAFEASMRSRIREEGDG
ncbi:RelA/SpoT domain-containing protein [Cellulosimicrobium composti]|uniref:RelA/SpoT domain-containing protein n=1 Tax=Cellulosimicrobium composti TaxID=2672572 RepID=UPI00379DC6A4